MIPVQLISTLIVACGWSVLANAMQANFTLDNDIQSSFIQRRLKSQERKEMQREILSILGLPHRPRPLLHERHTAAPMYMLDLYNAILEDGDQRSGIVYSYEPAYTTPGPPMMTQQDSRFLSDADMVMSFVNLGEHLMIIFFRFSKLSSYQERLVVLCRTVTLVMTKI